MIKTWAVIKDGVVVNTVLATDEDIKDPAYLWIDITGTTNGIGCLYDGTNFSRKPEEVKDSE